MKTHTHTHTPGPWKIEKAGFQAGIIIAHNRVLGIAEVFGGGDPDSANARLIAAAPELLEALEDAAFLMRMAAKIAGPMQDSFKRSAEDAAKALAKAEGNT